MLLKNTQQKLNMGGNLMLNTITNLLRIKHYIKNIVIFLPLILTSNFTDTNSVKFTLIAFIAFSIIASAIYIFNDIADIDFDRTHLKNKKRPIASGKISKNFAGILFCLLLIFGFSISLCANYLIFISLLFYVLLNIFYTYKLKFLPYVDVFCIALGFVLRVLTGYIAIAEKPIALIILLVFFTSMFFTSLKRKLEYAITKDTGCLRKTICDSNNDVLNQIITINALLSIMFYFLYSLNEITIHSIGTMFCFTGIPFVFIIFQLISLSYSSRSTTDPANFIYDDKTTKILILIYFVTLVFCLSIKFFNCDFCPIGQSLNIVRFW